MCNCCFNSIINTKCSSILRLPAIYNFPKILKGMGETQINMKFHDLVRKK